MERLINQLESAGLSNKEAKVYILLLKNAPIGGGKLAKILHMDRTHTYNILKNLVNKGFASHIIKDKKKLFQTTSPKNLLNKIKEREQAIKSIIPKLQSLEKTKAEISNVKVLEGKQGMKVLIQMLFESKPKDICVYGGTGKSYEIFKYEMSHITKKTKALKIKGKIITSEKLRKKVFTKLPNFKTRYIKEITPSSTMIFGNKVSINVFDEKPFVILIENKSVANSYKNYFNYLWKQAKK